MSKKILIIGNSANAYALAKKLANNHEIYITPASDSLKEFATCLDIREDAVTELLEFVMETGIDLTIPVSQKSLSTNIVNVFSNNEQPIFAPSQTASKIVFDKALAKKVMYKLRIPTPKFGIFEKQNMAIDYVKNQKKPFVIKTNESSSAVVLTTPASAKNIIDTAFIETNPKILVEDYIWGTPFSFYVLTDGYKALPLGSSITYKHSLEGDGGQLTSGMGACSPNFKFSLDNENFLMENVVYPILEFLEREYDTYTGILGVNGILTDDNELYVLGFNSFMQDADATSVLELLNEDLVSLFETCIVGSFSDEVEIISQQDGYATSLVLSCKNKENKSNSISGLDLLDEDTVITYYPSVDKNRYMEYEANSGSVLVLTTKASTVNSASKKMYAEAAEISFKGQYYRRDICTPLETYC